MFKTNTLRILLFFFESVICMKNHWEIQKVLNKFLFTVHNCYLKITYIKNNTQKVQEIWSRDKKNIIVIH